MSAQFRKLCCNSVVALTILVGFSAFADQQLSIQVNCRADEYAAIDQPAPQVDNEFTINAVCKPATCYYQKQGVFPATLFSNSWTVFRESSLIAGQPGGTGDRQASKTLAQDIVGENKAKEIANSYVAQGICQKTSSELSNVPNL